MLCHDQRIHRDRLASLEKERLEGQSTLGELQSRVCVLLIVNP